MLSTKTKSVYILCLSFSLIIMSCDVQQSFQHSETLSSDISPSESSNLNEIEVQQADPGILYSVTYDQSTATYSSRKPAALKNSIHEYMLNGYESVKTSITIDINGNITMATEWLDGNADLNMPLESFDRTSHIQPAHQNDPVIRSEMANGFIRYYSKSGKVAHEYAIEESTLKIDTGEFIRNLKNSRKNLDADSRIERNMTSLRQNGTNFQQMATKMGQIDPTGTGKWIIVGHSLGGLIARVGYHELVNNPQTDHFDIRTILTVATPHQGARATHVSNGPIAGYINVKPVLDEFTELMIDPLEDKHPDLNGLLTLIMPNALDKIDKLPNMLNSAIDDLEYFENASVSNNIKDIIGLNGSVIQDINSGQIDAPALKRSVFGSEKRFIPVRSADELDGDGNEASTLDNFDNLRWYYRANANAWNAQVYIDNINFRFGSAAESRRKRDSWNRGRNALDNIDGYWGEVIDSYAIEMVQIREYVVVECEDEDPQDPTQPGTFPTDDQYDCWEFQYTTVPMSVATKNDVIIGPNYAVWNPNEDPDVLNGVNLYYDDVPADGGYNHFELRRYKRAYALPRAFFQGDLAPPMKQASEWLGDTVFN